MKNYLDNGKRIGALMTILVLAVGAISIVGTSKSVMGQDGNGILGNILGGCIYGACKNTKITGNASDGFLAGCVFAGCKDTGITGPNQPTPNTATLIVSKVFDCPSTAGCGGNAFTIKVTGNNPSPESFTASTKGTEVTLGPGLYGVSETSPDGFITSFTDDCNSNANGPIKAGETRTCTVTNTKQT